MTHYSVMRDARHVYVTQSLGNKISLFHMYDAGNECVILKHIFEYVR